MIFQRSLDKAFSSGGKLLKQITWGQLNIIAFDSYLPENIRPSFTDSIAS